eukprot:SAG11_NODE_3971_length_2128_cov_1.225727_2_plen_163_part_00
MFVWNADSAMAHAISKVVVDLAPVGEGEGKAAAAAQPALWRCGVVRAASFERDCYVDRCVTSRPARLLGHYYSSTTLYYYRSCSACENSKDAVLTVLTALDSWSFVVSRDLLSAGRPVTCEPWHVFITPSDEEQDLSDGESDSEGGAIVQRRSDDAEAALGV